MIALLEKNKKFTIMQGMTKCLEKGYGGIRLEVRPGQLMLEIPHGTEVSLAITPPTEAAQAASAKRERLDALRQIIGTGEQAEVGYSSEVETKAFFGMHGTKLGESRFRENEHEKFGVLSKDAEGLALTRVAGLLVGEAVPRGIVDQWALQVAAESRRLGSPEEEIDWRDRSMMGFADFAERNLGLAVSDIPSDPFLVIPSPISPPELIDPRPRS